MFDFLKSKIHFKTGYVDRQKCNKYDSCLYLQHIYKFRELQNLCMFTYNRKTEQKITATMFE